MPAAVGNIDSAVFHMVYKTVFFIDSPAVLTLQISPQGFRFADSLQASIAFNILYQEIDPFQRFLSCVCQYR